MKMLHHSFRSFRFFKASPSMSSITINTSNTTAATFRKKSTHRLPSFRLFSSERTSAEISMEKALQTKLKTIHVQVQDVSNGCGSMYDIQVVSSDFQGQTRVKQHRMVNEILKEEIQSMHGLTIRTMTPEQFHKEVEK